MSTVIETNAAGMQWRIDPEHREQLLGSQGLRLDEWIREGQARVIKHAPHRTVYQVHLPGLHFFLKQTRPVDLKSRFLALVRPSKALDEYERALAVAARDVPTFTPLAAGVPERGNGDSYLLTHALEQTCPLNTFLEMELPTWTEQRQQIVRRRLVLALGGLLARMHHGGVIHNDLHAGNLLVQLSDEEPRLFLIDLLAVRVGAPLSWQASRDNLIMLNRWFSLRLSNTDRLRFWHTYCATRRALQGQNPKGGCSCPHHIREIETRTAASNLAFWRHLDHRCTKTSRRFRCVRSASARGHVVADLDRAVVDELLRDPDAPFNQLGVKLLKDSRSSTVAELELPLHGVMQKVIYKRFRVTSRLDPWLALLRPTGAMRSWTMGHGMRLRWLPTPRPLLVLHRRRHGLDQEGYILTAKVNEAEELRDFVDRIKKLSSRERREKLRPVLDETARLIRILHARRLSHRDLKAANLLVTRQVSSLFQSASSEPWEPWPLTNARVWFIDLVGVRLYRHLSQRRKVQNLARLNASFLAHPAVTLADRLRFLRCYLGNNRDWKTWWRQIEAATRVKVERNQRTGRVLC